MASQSPLTNCQKSSLTGISQDTKKHKPSSSKVAQSNRRKIAKQFSDAIAQSDYIFSTLDNYIFNWLEGTRPHRRQRCSSQPLPCLTRQRYITGARSKSIPNMLIGITKKRKRGTQSSTLQNLSRCPVDSKGTPSAASSGSILWPSYDNSSITRASSTSCKGSLVESPLYRTSNLRQNGVYIECMGRNAPDAIHALGAGMGKQRMSPEPSDEQVETNRLYQNMRLGCEEELVQVYIEQEVLSSLSREPRVAQSRKVSMYKDFVPSRPTPSNARVSQPKPDALYGYSEEHAFEEKHRVALDGLPARLAGTPSGLILPFLIMEYKGEGPCSNGNLWVAENQCIGAASTCVNIAQHLNKALKDISYHPGPVQQIDHATFSVAMSNRSATLFISWQAENLSFYTTEVNSFALSRPAQFRDFRRHMRNIVDWGANQRLLDIHNCLEVLLEGQRLQATTVAQNPW